MILFLQYLNQRKKFEVEEKRIKQRKARDDFLAMLEVSLLNSTKLSSFYHCNILICMCGNWLVLEGLISLPPSSQLTF
jgi:hypothetical protein